MRYSLRSASLWISSFALLLFPAASLWALPTPPMLIYGEVLVAGAGSGEGTPLAYTVRGEQLETRVKISPEGLSHYAITVPALQPGTKGGAKTGDEIRLVSLGGASLSAFAPMKWAVGKTLQKNILLNQHEKLQAPPEIVAAGALQSGSGWKLSCTIKPQGKELQHVVRWFKAERGTAEKTRNLVPLVKLLKEETVANLKGDQPVVLFLEESPPELSHFVVTVTPVLPGSNRKTQGPSSQQTVAPVYTEGAL